jgi:two-component system response regulator
MSTVLLVEDNPLNRDMLTKRLKRKNFAVSWAENGEIAVEKAKAEKPDLILMDLSLPVMDGWQATQLIKTNEATKEIPIIVLTAHAMPEDREKAMAMGADEYDTKPIEFKGLLQKIKDLL